MKKTININLSEYGKMPPQAIELEEAVLGACILEKDAILNIIDILKPKSFYKDAHQKIFSAILDLSNKLQPIDLMTVTEKLRKSDELELIGGAIYIAQLTTKVASASHIEHHSRIIAEKFIQCEIIRISSEMLNKAYDPMCDIDDLLNFSESELFKISQGSIKKEPVKIDIAVKDALKQIDKASNSDKHLSGIPSGFNKIDKITSGWQPSDLIIIAARPSMGKTAFAVSMIRNIGIEYNTGVAIFSLEMSTNQITNRLIICETQIGHQDLRNGNLQNYEWEKLNNNLTKLISAPIFIDDTPAISIFELRAKCRRLVMSHGVKMILVDYMQLMKGERVNNGNREQEISSISRGLKGIAKELNIPVIALSQLNRCVEMRSGNKRPQLSDLRESGAIEQDADIVLFIHRPEKYGFLEDEEGNSLKGLAEIIIAKHRNGALSEINLKFRENQARFVEDQAKFEDELKSNDNFDNDIF